MIVIEKRANGELIVHTDNETDIWVIEENGAAYNEAPFDTGRRVMDKMIGRREDGLPVPPDNHGHHFGL